jgi:hypothetical protein
MEWYAPVAGTDPFAASADLFTVLTHQLAGAEAGGLTEAELENLVDGRGREVLRQLLQDHLDLRAAREEQAARQAQHPAATGADGITRTRLARAAGRQAGPDRRQAAAARPDVGVPPRQAQRSRSSPPALVSYVIDTRTRG